MGSFRSWHHHFYASYPIQIATCLMPSPPMHTFRLRHYRFVRNFGRDPVIEDFGLIFGSHFWPQFKRGHLVGNVEIAKTFVVFPFRINIPSFSVTNEDIDVESREVDQHLEECYLTADVLKSLSKARLVVVSCLLHLAAFIIIKYEFYVARIYF